SSFDASHGQDTTQISDENRENKISRPAKCSIRLQIEAGLFLSAELRHPKKRNQKMRDSRNFALNLAFRFLFSIGITWPLARGGAS
ncbi:MAG: hypothetical protein IJT30_01635, partial [Muribaculaceae bacterium]|nr:hypothetical protein [Muribaculaceae bacterium]